MALSSRNKVSVNFSMASMTDIVFLLLIFFMITSTFVSPPALKVNLPSSDSKVKKEKTTVSVNINADYSYAVNQEGVALDFLESAIMNELQGVENPGIILYADKTVPIEYVVNVMNVANKHRVALVLATSPSN